MEPNTAKNLQDDDDDTYNDFLHNDGNDEGHDDDDGYSARAPSSDGRRTLCPVSVTICHSMPILSLPAHSFDHHHHHCGDHNCDHGEVEDDDGGCHHRSFKLAN